MARAYGSRALMALAFESTFGTTPGSGFLKMPFVSSNLGASQALLESEVLGNGRDPIDPDLDVQVADGDIVVPVDTEAFGVWLKMLLGDPVTTGSGPYTHVFSSKADTLPSASLEIGMPEVPHFAMNKGLMVDSLSLSWQRAGQLTATLATIAQGEADPASSTSAGTPTEFDYYRFANRHGSITRGGSDLGDVTNATLRYTNNLDRVEEVRNDGLLGGIDPTMAMLNGQLTMRHSSTALISAATGATPAAMTFELARTASQSLVIAMPRVFLSRPKVGPDGPRGVSVTYDWIAAVDTNGDPMLTATLINAVETY
jgi:hypothetical protein